MSNQGAIKEHSGAIRSNQEQSRSNQGALRSNQEQSRSNQGALRSTQEQKSPLTRAEIQLTATSPPPAGGGSRVPKRGESRRQCRSDAIARTTLATGSAPSNRALTQRMPPSAKWRRTVSSRTAIEAMCDLPTPPSPLRTITCHRTSSERPQRVLRGSSEGHWVAIKEPSEGHQSVLRGSSEGHQRAIGRQQSVLRGSSECHQRVIRGSSES